MRRHTIVDRARSLPRSDRGDAPPEILVTASIVSALAAVAMWLMSTSASWSGFVRWGALGMGVFAVVFIGVYASIKAQDAIDAARWRRTHPTGE